MVHVMLILCSPRQVICTREQDAAAQEPELREPVDSSRTGQAYLKTPCRNDTHRHLSERHIHPLETPNLEPGVPGMASCIRFRVQLRIDTYVWADIPPCIEGGDVFSSFFVIARDQTLCAAQLPGTQDKQKGVSNSRHHYIM
jgi:hypothetical protein